jgi:Clp amino terminal domain, pathogenicity island component
MGKNKKPMLTVLVEEEKLQRFRDYASLQGMSMGAIVNQLIDRLLSGESSPEPLKYSIGNSDKYIETMTIKSIEEKIALSIDNNNKSIEAIIANSIDNNNKSLEETMAASIDNYTKTLPPTLSLQDIERETRRECGRLIGSAISSVTKTNNEVIMLSNEESHRLGHNFVYTEQLLIGLIGEETGIAAKVLKSMGVTLKDARIEVEKIIGRGSGFLSIEIPFTPGAKRILAKIAQRAKKVKVCDSL